MPTFPSAAVPGWGHSLRASGAVVQRRGGLGEGLEGGQRGLPRGPGPPPPLSKRSPLPTLGPGSRRAPAGCAGGELGAGEERAPQRAPGDPPPSRERAAAALTVVTGHFWGESHRMSPLAPFRPAPGPPALAPTHAGPSEGSTQGPPKPAKQLELDKPTPVGPGCPHLSLPQFPHLSMEPTGPPEGTALN